MEHCIDVGSGLKIPVATTEYLTTRKTAEQTKLNGEALMNVDHSKYLGSVINTDGTVNKVVDLRVLAAWSSWQKSTGVLYDKKMSLQLKSKVQEVITRPALTYGSEYWAMWSNHRRKLPPQRRGSYVSSLGYRGCSTCGMSE